MARSKLFIGRDSYEGMDSTGDEEIEGAVGVGGVITMYVSCLRLKQ